MDEPLEKLGGTLLPPPSQSADRFLILLALPRERDESKKINQIDRRFGQKLPVEILQAFGACPKL